MEVLCCSERTATLYHLGRRREGLVQEQTASRLLLPGIGSAPSAKASRVCSQNPLPRRLIESAVSTRASPQRNRSEKMFFDEVQGGPPDVMYDLKVRADRDAHAEKVDLGVGIYRNGEGLYQELDCIKEVCVKRNRRQETVTNGCSNLGQTCTRQE